MKIPRSHARSGIALIIVLVSVFVLAVLAGGFAYSMKVETKLARNAQFDDQMQWYGRTGVEVARTVLALSSEPYDARNQYWAGGPGSPGESNSPLANLDLEDWQIGNGSISFKLDGNPVVLKITDEDRKFNINVADESVLRQAMILAGADVGESSVVVDSILDWIDPDDFTHVGGWESKDYESLPRPYFAKNGPLDDLSELLLVHGVTPELYWGPRIGAHPESQVTHALNGPRRVALRGAGGPAYNIGLVDLFCCISEGHLNINTADPIALQLIPGIDENVAHGIQMTRAGPDGVDGNEDDLPFRNVGELINVPGMSTLAVGGLQNFFTVRSSTFSVEVETQVGDVKSRFHALLRRLNQRDVQILYMEAE